MKTLSDNFIIKVKIGILFIFSFQNNLNAQDNFTFHHLTVKNGLSQSSIFCLAQDSRGFLWIGTGDGLDKYDGYKFTHYKHIPNDSNSLSAPAVMSIFEDVDGKLWIGTDGGGLNIFDPYTEKFARYKNNPSDSTSISSNLVYATVVHDKGSRYVVGTFGGGLNFFDKTTQKFSAIRHDPNDSTSLSNDRIMRVIKDSDGMFWLATRNGLNMFNSQTGKITVYKSDSTNQFSIVDNRVQDVFEDSHQRLWIGTFLGGICEFDRAGQKFIRYSQDKKNPTAGFNQVNCFYEDSFDKIWIGTNGNGITILDRKTRTINSLENIPDNENTLSYNEIFCFLKDKSGLLWIGTNGGGVDIFTKSYSNFNRYNELIDSSFSNKNVYGIFVDKQQTQWIGTNGGGMYAIDPISRILTNYSNIQSNKSSLPNNEVWRMFQDKNETFWVGTFGGGLNIFNKDNSSFTPFNLKATIGFKPNIAQILSIYEDNEGLLWIATNNRGLYVYDENKNPVNWFSKEDRKKNSLNSKTVYAVCDDPDDNVYIGTFGGGLNVLDKKTNSFTYYLSDPNNLFSISSNDVYSIYVPDASFIWVGTNGGGLNLFEKKSKRFISYLEQDGLPNNVIYGILPDNKGNLWLSTNKGICKFHIDIKHGFSITDKSEKPKPDIKNYFSLDGLSSDEFNLGACFKDKNGLIYFGNINGVTCFQPDSIFDNTYLPPAFITNFKVFEKNYPLDSSIEFKKLITLNYDQDFFSFEYTGLNYLFPEKNQYAVMMDGFDKDWIYTGTRRYASYTNLDPGNYIFKVKASNNDGVWNEKYASVQIVITPPFWKTWWFKSLLVLFFALLTYSIYKYRVRQIRKEEQKKTAFNKALAEVEMKALRAQMNPHFIFNSLNSINKYIVSNDQNAASDYLARFSRLIRLVLENSMHKEVALNKDLETLELYMQMERLRFEKVFEYEIKIADTLEAESILIPPLLLQPFVENAIWHGLMPKESAGKILIEIKSTDHSLQCIVEDNGVGREKAAEIKSKKQSGHESLGMKVTAERIEILKQQKSIESKVVFIDLKDEQGNAAGTCAEIFIPLEYNY